MNEVEIICGVDEAGRGPLAGPVCAAAVILHPGHAIAGVRDSKTLTAAARERLAANIRGEARAWGLGWASVAEIDSLNIRRATLLAMQRAAAALTVHPTLILVDGLDGFDSTAPCRPIVGGDGLVPAIAAASILAKTARDQHMTAIDARYPGYGFAQHKGYGAQKHLEALARLGPCPEHRRSFRPVAAAARRGAVA